MVHNLEQYLRTKIITHKHSHLHWQISQALGRQRLRVDDMRWRLWGVLRYGHTI